ncbi:GNAT family N-acetyltransferase [Methylobacterium sp. J-077]|uniref:GNAT family N-acetyltransferase n=1 Tax=Methylobacterium sp. J-077 TaxID=2836656 RepID=UPI001FBA19F0|nr:GNAT family N-acetyltransferase [Methylobacterium sp. J-077]MCJ2123307.1 bifunctional class I SAM-dependent methyltransferase/GNAT family N-acetyltransferase [Methylobacterium sp. J-077]
MTSDIDLAWRVEEACLNAWPSPRQLLVHGYLLRATGGTSKRQNSVNPLRGSGAPEPAIAAGQALYTALGRRPIFRVPAIAPQMEPLLAGGDYTVVDETCTLFRDLTDLPGGPDPGVRLAPTPDAAWLALRDAVNRADAAAAQAFRDTVETLILPRAFASATVDGGIGAFAFGVLDGDLLVIESVATPEPLRGRGHAKRAVGALLHWARGRGARAACLQVVAANTPARALYRGLGFERELYRYHYRVGPEPA